LDDRAEEIVRRIETFLPASSEVLDIGGGWGFYRRPLERRGHRHTVLDVVRPRFQKAPVVLYDGGRMPFENEAFDVSLLVTVLHHVGEPDRLMAEAARVTRRYIIVVEDIYSTPAGRWWTEWRDRILNFEYVGHPCGFKTAGEWCRYFESRGLPVLENKEAVTRLSWLRIRNGFFVLDAAACRQAALR
jgi:SAM-dependent methyltransferase